MRRGYYFVPKYLFGKPADTLNQGRPLPPRIKQAIDSRVLQMFTGDPMRFGFPKPDYKIYESHPIVNSLVLHHLGHGDIRVRKDVERLRRRRRACSSTAAAADYDLIVLATGYHLHYPFVDPDAAATGPGMAPDLYLNVFTPARPEPLRARHDRGVRASAGRAATSRPSWWRAYLKARRRAPDRGGRLRAAGRTVRGRTCRAATTTSGWSGWPTTSTRTPTARAVRAEIERLGGCSP